MHRRSDLSNDTTFAKYKHIKPDIQYNNKRCTNKHKIWSRPLRALICSGCGTGALAVISIVVSSIMNSSVSIRISDIIYYLLLLCVLLILVFVISVTVTI